MKNIQILYEDAHIIAVNKPAGLAVQGGEGVSCPLDDILSQEFGFKIYLVHRLDKDTAGILLAAKTSAAATKYGSLLNTPAVCKTYTAFCIGASEKKQGIIDDPVSVRGDQKAAQTAYRQLETVYCNVDGQNYAVTHMELTLGTGRMHQIRIHLAKNGLPIVADDRHGDFKQNKVFQRAFAVKRLQLAACSLVFPNADGKPIALTVDLPEHMTNFREKIGKTTSF